MIKKLLAGVIVAITGAFLFGPVSATAAGDGAVFVNSAVVAGENVIVSVSASDLPDSDDGNFYLFAEKVYQEGPAGAPLASMPVNYSASFSIPLGYRTVNCHLYDKFQVAVARGGVFVPVSNSKYISNPEALAGFAFARVNSGKKGLILDGAKIGNGNTEVLSLGVQQGAYNINLEDVYGGNCAAPFEYNGKTYYFDTEYLSQYDHCIRTTTSQGIGLTMVLLNPYVRGEELLISPVSRGGLGKSNYYMMNTSEDAGLEALEAIVAYLALRYNGQNGFGQVDNWVIGNEVNAKNIWNYASDMDVSSYARYYADSLRVCYTAIKSKNPNAIVCCSFDNNWNAISNGGMYTARSVLEAMNAYIISKGNFDWGIAFHPYNYPMTWTSFWTPKSEAAASMVQHNTESPYISMENIEQLSDYMCQQAMRNTKGEVRPILLTEVGYSSTQGDEAQAAAIVYAYQRAATNHFINMIIFNRQTDFGLEVRDGLSVGLTRQDGSPKLSYEFYQQMNGPNAGAYIQRSAAYMGIADWNGAMNAR